MLGLFMVYLGWLKTYLSLAEFVWGWFMLFLSDTFRVHLRLV